MVRFNLQQWVDLVTHMDMINDSIEEFDDLKIHLGRNTYLRVQTHRQRVDIREYFLPKEAKCSLDRTPQEFEAVLIPTRRGISLTYEEWKSFSEKAMPLINAGAEGLQLARAGTCTAHHNSQETWLSCTHCNPNGSSFWTTDC